MFSWWKSRKPVKQRRGVVARWNYFRPRVELLEARLAPAILTWVGDVDGNWDTKLITNTNWSTDALPKSGDTLIFGSTGNNHTNVNDTKPGNTYTLQFTGGTYSISGNAIKVSGAGITDSSLGSVTLSTDLLLTGNLTVSASAIMIGSMLTLDGVLSEQNAGTTLTKTGASTLTLSGANTYTGATTVSGGTLQLGASNALSTSTALTVSGGIFALGGNSNTVSAVTLSSGSITGSGGTLTSASDFAVQSGTVSANLGGGVGLAKTTGGTATLSGTNTYTGPTTISGGVLSVATIGDGGTAGNLGQATNAPANLVLAGGTLQYTGITASTNRNFTLATGTTSTIDVTTNTLTISGAAAATTGSLTKSGSGTLVLSGANQYTGATAINAGILTVSGELAIADSSAVVMANVAGATLNLASNETIGSLTGGGTTGGNVTLGGNTLTVGADDTSPAAYAGVISGGGGQFFSLQKTGSGTLTLSGANTYTGDTSIDQGVLSASNIVVSGGGSNLGNCGFQVFINSGGKLLYTGGNANYTRGCWVSGNGEIDTTTAGVTLTLSVGGNGIRVNGLLTIGGAGNTSISTGISDNGIQGGLSMSGTGTLTLNAKSLYTGDTTINSGTLKLGADDVMFYGGTAGNVIVNNPGTLDLNGHFVFINGLFGSGTVDNVAGGGSALLMVGHNNATASFSGLIKNSSGTVNLTKVGLGTQTLSGANTYSGITTIGGFSEAGGVLSVSILADGGMASGIGNSGSGAGNLIFDDGGGTLQYTGTGASTNRLFTLATTGALDASGSGALTFSNPGAVTTFGANLTLSGTGTGTFTPILAGAGGLIKTGAGTWFVGGANTYTGGTFIDGGVLSVSSLANGGLSSNIGASSNDVFNLSFNGGTLRYTGPTASTDRLFAFNQLGGTLDASGTGPLTFSNPGAATTIAAASNGADLSQVTIINVASTAGFRPSNGNLNVQTTTGWDTVFYTGTTPTSFTGIQYGSGFLATGGTVTSAIWSNGGMLTLTGSSTAANTLGPVFGNGNVNNPAYTTRLTKTGAGTWVLGSANVYTGATTISGGVLELGVANALPRTSNVTDNATLEMNTFSDTIGALSGAGFVQASGGVPVTLTVGATGSSATFSGLIREFNGSTVALTKTGSGTETLSGANSYTGLTTINAGTLAYGADNVLGTGDVTINGGRLDLGASHTDSVGTVTLAGGGSITGTGTSALTSTGTFEMQSGSVSAILAGNGIPLNKTTSGTVTLSGANTYTGATTVNAGNLQVMAPGSLNGSAVSVNSGGLLLGSGTITGNVVVNSGGFLLPGDFIAGIGSSALTVAGNVTLGASAEMFVIANSATNYSQLIVSGTHTVSLDGTATVGVSQNYTPLGSDDLTIISADSSMLSGNLSTAIPPHNDVSVFYFGKQPNPFTYGPGATVVLKDPPPPDGAPTPVESTTTIAVVILPPTPLPHEIDDVIRTLLAAIGVELKSLLVKSGDTSGPARLPFEPPAVLLHSAASSSPWTLRSEHVGQVVVLDDLEPADEDLFPGGRDAMPAAPAADGESPPTPAEIDAAFRLAAQELLR